MQLTTNFEEFLNENAVKIAKITINIKDLPESDEWIQENEWEEFYNLQK